MGLQGCRLLPPLTCPPPPAAAHMPACPPAAAALTCLPACPRSTPCPVLTVPAPPLPFRASAAGPDEYLQLNPQPWPALYNVHEELMRKYGERREGRLQGSSAPTASAQGVPTRAAAQWCGAPCAVAVPPWPTVAVD